MDIQKIIEFHKKGLSNRQIAKEMNSHHNSIGYHLKKMGLNCNGWKGVRLQIIDENFAKCSRCEEISSLKNWPMAREGKKHPYRLSYCRKCRKKQIHEALNNNLESFISHRYGHLRGRAKKEKVHFDMTKFDLLKIYDLQKGKCFYTDEILHINSGKGRLPNSLSIDRVDNSKGYTKQNVVLCTSRFNTIKSNMSLEEVEKWMPPIYEKIKMWHRRGIFVFDVSQGKGDF